jgi:hypothetical protein
MSCVIIYNGFRIQELLRRCLDYKVVVRFGGGDEIDGGRGGFGWGKDFRLR